MTIQIDELEELRAPLTRFCYRMLGSAADSDDAVQETLIRAATKSDQYDPQRARVTTWVHSIATNVCLDMLRGARRRAVLMDTPPAADGSELGAPLPADHWVEPMPGAKLFGSADPAEVVLERESVRLAFIALLQRLPPRQRAVLILRDVVLLSANETAQALEATVPGVNSALQRARGTLRATASETTDLAEPSDRKQRELLRRFVRAFESHDVAELTEVLRTDAISSMPPFAWRVEGGQAIAALMGASDACAQDRLIPTDVNGQAGFGQYRPADDGVLRPFALVAVEMRGQGIGHIAMFLGSGERFAEFGLPESLGAQNRVVLDR